MRILHDRDGQASRMRKKNTMTSISHVCTSVSFENGCQNVCWIPAEDLNCVV